MRQKKFAYSAAQNHWMVFYDIVKLSSKFHYFVPLLFMILCSGFLWKKTKWLL